MAVNPGTPIMARTVTRSPATSTDRKSTLTTFRTIGLHDEILVTNTATRQSTGFLEPPRNRFRS